VRRAEQALHAAKERALRDLDVLSAHYGLLKAIAHQPGSSASAIARHVGVTAQTASTVLGRLEDRGAVVRRPHPRHAHVLEWDLTDLGRELLAAADARIGELEAHVREGLDPEDVARAHAVLEHARTVAGTFAPAGPPARA
jgi:DNA-binding MarR family transcriptional regulator